MSEKSLQIAEKREAKGKRRKGKIYTSECRVPKNSKKTEESLPKWSVQRNTGKKKMGKTSELFRKIRAAKGTFHTKIGTIKGQKWYGPDRSRRYLEEVAKIHRRAVQKGS